MAQCTVIKLKTVDQRLTAVQQPVLASGDVGTVRVEYALDSYWDGYTASGTFYTGKKPEDVYEQPLTDGACVVPWEALQEDGVLYIGLRGVDGAGLVKTAAPARYRVEKGSPCGTGTTTEPTPGVYQQLLVKARNAEEIAQGVRDDADSGKFTPVKGVDYYTEADRREIMVVLSDEVNGEEYKQAIAEEVPMVKVAEQPIFVSATDRMTDLEKVYCLLGNGHLYAKVYKEATETEQTTDIKSGVIWTDSVRISQSSLAISGSAAVGNSIGKIDLKQLAANGKKISIVVQLYNSITWTAAMLVANDSGVRADYCVNNYDYLSNGVHVVCDNGDGATSTPATIEITVEDVAAVEACTSLEFWFPCLTSAKASAAVTKTIIVVTSGGYYMVDTGIVYNQPADYEDRVINLEETAAEQEARLQTLENAAGGSASVPEYWLEELETKADLIQQAMEAAGQNKSAFLWYTDAHWDNGNSKMSPALLNYLYKNTPMNKVNFGGDIIGDPTALTHEKIKSVYTWRSGIKDLNHHSVIGNHDNLHKGGNDAAVSNLVYAFLLAPEETPDMVKGGDFYYYIDSPCEKTRYLYLDSGRFYLNEEETQFIIDALTSTPSGWHIVVISHVWFQYTSSSNPTVGEVNAHMQVLLNVLDAYNSRGAGNFALYYAPQSYEFSKPYDFSACGGRVEFCIGGHIHVDHEIYSTGGIPVILTASDVNQERSGDETEDAGTLGTTTEAAVFGIIADYNSRKITVVGVGRGTSREVSY